MKKFSVYVKFSIFFSILMFLGIVGIVFTQIIDLAVIETSMPWLITFAHSIGIQDIEGARRIVTIYVGIVFLFVFWFMCLAFKHGRRALERVKNSRAQSTQVYITTDEDVKKLKKQQAKNQAKESKMKTREQRLAEKAARKAEKATKKAAQAAKKEVKEEIKPVVEAAATVKAEKVEPKVQKASNKIDDILNQLK